MKNTAILAAKKAGSLLLRHFGRKIPGVKVKKGTSLVTDLDFEANRIITSLIKKKFPAHNIITEEDSPTDNGSEYTWYIDPIDGTHNFIRGLPLFGVSIALAKNGEVILGVLYLPALDKLYVAEKGKGAFLNGKRIFISRQKEVDFAFVLFDSSHGGKKKRLAFLKTIADRLFNERVLGCAIFACAMVAEGRSDALMFFKTNSWDIAAGFLIIEEAGGVVSDFSGKKWTPSDGSFIAANTTLHGKLFALLKKNG